MKLQYLTDAAIDAFVTAALAEDIGDGDHSTLASIPEKAHSQARLIIKGDGIIAGLSLAKVIFHKVSPHLDCHLYLNDGDSVSHSDIGLTVSGPARAILTAERLVLNCMQRMSGIATYTHKIAQLIADTETKLLDTRKTTPNARLIEKWAVAIGGGTNHRYGLYDMVMLKDNHIDFAGGITQAVATTRAYLNKLGKPLRIEVETRNLEEVKEALSTGDVDIIMLDNMTPTMMKEAVAMIGNQCVTEASGGITEDTIKTVAACGVNFISVGALTHSVKSMDISLKAYSE